MVVDYSRFDLTSAVILVEFHRCDIGLLDTETCSGKSLAVLEHVMVRGFPSSGWLSGKGRFKGNI